MSKRTRAELVWLSDVELLAVERCAKAEGVRLGTWLRRAVLAAAGRRELDRIVDRTLVTGSPRAPRKRFALIVSARRKDK